MAATKIHKVLKLIGYWNGPEDGDIVGEEPDPEFPDETAYIWPQDLVDPGWRLADRPLITSFLKSAPTINAYLGLSWCRFRCGIEHLGAKEYSDGEWVWPEGLAHYVERHLIRLPEEFITHICALGFRQPTEFWFLDPDYRQKYTFEWDTKFWEEWCKSQRKT